jgi:hypothetical protein
VQNTIDEFSLPCSYALLLLQHILSKRLNVTIYLLPVQCTGAKEHVPFAVQQTKLSGRRSSSALHRLSTNGRFYATRTYSLYRADTASHARRMQRRCNVTWGQTEREVFPTFLRGFETLIAAVQTLSHIRPEEVLSHPLDDECRWKNEAGYVRIGHMVGRMCARSAYGP